MKDLTVFDKDGRPVVNLTGDGKVLVEDGFSVKITGGEVKEQKDGFANGISFMWLFLLVLLAFGGNFTSGGTGVNWEDIMNAAKEISKGD